MCQPEETSMAKRPKQLDGLFHEGLKAMYFAEKNTRGIAENGEGGTKRGAQGSL
jgi:hypothetical protein